MLVDKHNTTDKLIGSKIHELIVLRQGTKKCELTTSARSTTSNGSERALASRAQSSSATSTSVACIVDDCLSVCCCAVLSALSRCW